MNDFAQIKQIFDVLKSAGVKSFNDMANMELTQGKLLSAQKHPWIADMAQILNSIYYGTESHIANTPGQIFMVDKVVSGNYQNVLKYSCVFPDRMIINSGEFHYLDKAQFSLIDMDFFRKLFWGRELLMNGIVHISPFCLCTDLTEGEGDINNAIIENLTLPDKNAKKIAQLDKSGFGNVEHVTVGKILVELPWLNNAGIDDYLDIIKSHQTEFLAYNLYLSHLSDATQNTEDYLRQFVKDFHDANVNIQIAVEKKQAQLKAKGVTAVLSVCLTAIPLLLAPDTAIMFSLIMGGGTVKQMLDLVPFVQETRAVCKESPFWVLWKWKNA